MKSLTDHLSQYASYHRDPRNIATHFVGIPMIVAAVVILLSRPVMADAGAGIPLSPAVAASLLTALYYVRLDLRLGFVMAALLAATVVLGAWAAAQSTTVWLWLGLGGFVTGWVIQFIGHVFEGRKPAFLDDVTGLIIGPLFVLVEALFLFGILPQLRQQIEANAGKVRRSR